jgi:hypothetical protein
MEIDRKWIVKVGDKEHVIEADYGLHIIDPDSMGSVLAHRDGTLWVDGVAVKTWDELPKEVSFEIEGKPALAKTAGLFSKGLELVFDKTKIKPVS